MKEITAIIQPVRLGPVREALSLVGVTGMTISDVRGFGSQGGSVDTYRGVEYRVDYVPKIKLDIIVSESYVDTTIDAIDCSSAEPVRFARFLYYEGTVRCRPAT